MDELKKLALKVFEERKEFVEKENERKKHEVDVEYEKSIEITKKAVEGILNIFKASNSENDNVKVWNICVFGQIKVLNVKVSFSENVQNAQFFDKDELNDNSPWIMLRKHDELKKAMKSFQMLLIPEVYVKHICKYFNENLSEYFEAAWTKYNKVEIKLKKPINCEKM